MNKKPTPIHPSSIAGKMGISDFIIGLSVAALGTSFPEIFVGISSIVNNNEELALGTIVGSNISNIAKTLMIINRS